MTSIPTPSPKRRRWLVWLVIPLGLIVVALVAVGVVIRQLDSPEDVPPDFRSPSALPATEPMPVDMMAFDSDRTGNFEIFAATPDDATPRELTSDPRFDSWWPRISPDRRTILFHRSPHGVHDLDFRKVSLWAMGADGTGMVELRPPGLDGWTVQGHVEWHPTGDRLVMFGGSRLSPQIWVTDRQGAHPRQITDRGGRNLDPSFSSDGRRIWFVGCPDSICGDEDQEIYAVEVGERGDQLGGQQRRMTDDSIRDQDPYESRDGRQLGWLSQYGNTGVGVWDVRIATIDHAGGPLVGARRLLNDKAVTSRPQWSADGSSVTSHRVEVGGSNFDLVRIDVATGDVTHLAASSPSNDEYPGL